MSNSMNYKIIPEKRIILESYIGTLVNEDYFHYKVQISNDPNYNPNYNIIIDFRNTEFDVNTSLIKEFIERLKANNKMYAQRKSAYITDTPHQTTVTYLFNTLKNESIIDSNTFTTVKSAINWVELPKEDLDFIEKELENLKL